MADEGKTRRLGRREILAGLTGLVALAGGSVTGEAEDWEAGSAPQSVAQSLAESRVYKFSKLPIVRREHGQVDQTVLQGLLVSGEALEVHETTLPPGQTPHAPHRHRHSELMLVRDGLLEFNDDGKLTTAGPGGVFFVGSNVLHGVTCVGDVAANYYVIAIGRDRIGLDRIRLDRIGR